MRVQLARALVRAGEKERALATLDLARLPAEFFREARPLSDELWSERLSRLERVSVIPAGHGPAPAEGALAITGDGLVGWRDDPLRGGSFFVAELATGKVLAHAGGSARAAAVLAARDAIFVDWSTPNGHFVSRIARDGTKEVNLRALRVTDVDPAGTRLLVRNGGKNEILAWPTLDRVADMGGEWIVMDWENRIGLAPVPDGILVVHEDGEEETLDAPHGGRSFFHLLAPGVYAWTGPSLVLQAWPRMTPIQLLGEGRDELPPPSIASDRRVARILLGGKPRRFEVDLEAGEVVSAPPGAQKLARSNAETGHWHPHADAVWRYKKDRHTELVTPEEKLLVLPLGVWPLAWTPDGLGLVCVSHESESERRLELWR